MLLPARMTVDVAPGRLFGRGRASAGSYSLNLDVGRRCHGAGACFVAFFLGQKGQSLAGGRKVRLARSIEGRFLRRSCGASCAPPQIMWVERGVLYTIQDRVPTDRQAKGVLTSLANSAIRGGPR